MNAPEVAKVKDMATKPAVEFQLRKNKKHTETHKIRRIYPPNGGIKGEAVVVLALKP